jgi:elongation factor Ts
LQVSIVAIKTLREKTGAGVMDCRGALLESNGDLDKASEILRQKGLAKADRKQARATSEGLVEAYIHHSGRMGAIVEINCETDFVAHTDGFKELAHNLAMQVAATNPIYIGNDDFQEEAGMPAEQVCLLLQPFIKDPDKKVQELVSETIAKMGENIMVKRFTRFEVGGSG